MFPATQDTSISWQINNNLGLKTWESTGSSVNEDLFPAEKCVNDSGSCKGTLKKLLVLSLKTYGRGRT